MSRLDTLVAENDALRAQARDMAAALGLLRERLALLRYQDGLRYNAAFVIAEIERQTHPKHKLPPQDNELVKLVQAARTSLDEAKELYNVWVYTSSHIR